MGGSGGQDKRGVVDSGELDTLASAGGARDEDGLDIFGKHVDNGGVADGVDSFDDNLVETLLLAIHKRHESLIPVLEPHIIGVKVEVLDHVVVGVDDLLQGRPALERQILMVLIDCRHAQRPDEPIRESISDVLLFIVVLLLRLVPELHRTEYLEQVDEGPRQLDGQSDDGFLRFLADELVHGVN